MVYLLNPQVLAVVVCCIPDKQRPITHTAEGGLRGIN